MDESNIFGLIAEAENRLDSLVPGSWLTNRVDTMACLIKLGFCETSRGVKYETRNFSCAITDVGRSVHAVAWQCNYGAFGEHNVFVLPQETRIYAGFPNWHQFLAGFSFMLTQARCNVLLALGPLAGTDVLRAVLVGGRHFREWEPIKKFVSERDVTDDDFIRLDQYVRREDSTFGGYSRLFGEIDKATRWSYCGFKQARELPKEKADEYKGILRAHRLRDFRKELKNAQPFRFIFIIGGISRNRDCRDQFEIDFSKRRIILQVRSFGCVGNNQIIDYSVGAKDIHCLPEAGADSEKRWRRIVESFERCDFASLRYGDNSHQDLDAVKAEEVAIAIKKGRTTLASFTAGPDIGEVHARAIADLIGIILQDASQIDDFMKRMVTRLQS